MGRGLLAAGVVLVLCGACGGGDALGREQEAWCTENAANVVLSAVILQDFEGVLGDTPWDWTPVWGERTDEIGDLFSVEDDSALAAVARAANREAYDDACRFLYDLDGHLTRAEREWCEHASAAVRQADPGSEWELLDPSGWQAIRAEPDAFSAACRSAYRSADP